MGLFDKAMAGLGKGLADVGETQLRAQVDELRQMRLAQYAAYAENQKAHRDRTWELEDAKAKQEWEREKLGLEHRNRMAEKGAGRGGGGGGGDGEDGEGGLLGDAWKTNGQLVNVPGRPGAQLVNPRTGEVRQPYETIPAQLPPDQAGPPTRGPRAAAVNIDLKTGTESQSGGGSSGGKPRYSWGGLEVAPDDVIKAMTDHNENVPRSQRLTVEQFMQQNGIKPIGDLSPTAGPARPAPMAGQREAPAKALQALMDNPDMAGEFQAKYGYLPRWAQGR